VTVEDLKNKLASIEVWKQSISSQGCIFGLEFKPDGTSWRKTPCEICHCQGNQTRCEAISGCTDNTTPSPSTEESVMITDDDDDDDDEEDATSSGDERTTRTTVKISPTPRQLSESELFTINKKRRQRRGFS